jgi:DEAD/DEAH box helicase domain-containing protein
VAVPKDKVHILQQKQQKMLRKARAYCGLIGVRREVKEYWKIVPGGEARLEEIRWDISIPEDICTFNTEAFWLVLPNHYKTINKAELESALHAIEHALLTVIPKWINCDPNDIKGAYTTECPKSGGNPIIFIFDKYPGGIGLARSCFQRIHDMLRDCIRLIETCKCKEETGCPSCIQTSRCERQNKNLNKKLALKILKEVTPNSL